MNNIVILIISIVVLAIIFLVTFIIISKNKINESFIINTCGIMEKPEIDQKKEYIERVCSTMSIMSP